MLPSSRSRRTPFDFSPVLVVGLYEREREKKVKQAEGWEKDKQHNICEIIDC